MSGPNPSELGKSQNQENPITRNQVKKNTELAKIVAQNRTAPLKPKRTVTAKEKVTKDKSENISNNDKTNISLKLDNISLEKTLTFEQFETAGTSNLSDSNNWRNSNSKTNSSIICGSIDQDETLKLRPLRFITVRRRKTGSRSYAPLDWCLGLAAWLILSSVVSTRR